MEKITKHETKLWINHAIAKFQGLDKNQKNLAMALGIEETRLSEMKSGKGMLSPNLMTKIVDECGAPKRGRGRFEYAEIFNDVDDFFMKYHPTSINRYIQRLMKASIHEGYIDELFSGIDLETDLSDTPESPCRDLVTKLINELIRNDDFNEKCISYREILKSKDTKDDFWITDSCLSYWEGAFKMGGLIIKTEKACHAIYQQWLITQEHPEYRFPLNNNFNLNSAEYPVPVVITGERILRLDKYSLSEFSTINRKTTDRFGPKKNHIELYNNSLYIDDLNTKPDFWSSVRCDLYLGEALNYHMVIHLSPSVIGDYDFDSEDRDKWESAVELQDRVIVIPNINSLKLLGDIEKLQKWCDLSTDNHYELKQSIARNGGYVPGAYVLV